MPSVYALGDPRTGEIRYVGIAQDVYKRYAQHLNHPHSNEEKNAWMDEIKAAGMVPTLTILESNVDDRNIFKRERHWIQVYLAQGAPLLNILNLHSQTLRPHAPKKRSPKCLLFDAKEVQERLGVSEGTLFRLLKRRELKGFKIGRIWKFEESDIEAFIQRRKEIIPNA